MNLIKYLQLTMAGVLCASFLVAVPVGVVQAKEDKKVKNGGGPPSWAPAHGYRRKFQYWPKQKVYYDATAKKYFWLDLGIVKVGTQLPDSITISGSGVTTELDTDKPKKTNFLR